MFVPYKKAFRRYKDAWVLRHLGSPATKQLLGLWISLGLQRALTNSNIEGAFRAIGIWPLNCSAIDKYLGPSKQFQHRNSFAEGGDNQEQPQQQGETEKKGSQEKNDEGDKDIALAEINEELIPTSEVTPQHYFVPNGVHSDTESKSQNLREKHHGEGGNPNNKPQYRDEHGAPHSRLARAEQVAPECGIAKSGPLDIDGDR